MKIKSLLAAIIASGTTREELDHYTEESIADNCNALAEEILKQNGDNPDEELLDNIREEIDILGESLDKNIKDIIYEIRD